MFSQVELLPNWLLLTPIWDKVKKILIRKANKGAERGQIVAVIVKDILHEATLKILRKTRGITELHSANSAYRPMVFSGWQRGRIRIVGKLVGIIRRSYWAVSVHSPIILPELLRWWCLQMLLVRQNFRSPIGSRTSFVGMTGIDKKIKRNSI